MTPSPLALLSLSNTFTQVGAIAAFAALFGIAVLSLLSFSQARELKRLREWAGRAPERAADLEQRVSASAAARVQQPVAGVQPAQRIAPGPARAVTAAGPATRVVGAPVTPPIPVAGPQPLTPSGVPAAAQPQTAAGAPAAAQPQTATGAPSPAQPQTAAASAQSAAG